MCTECSHDRFIPNSRDLSGHDTTSDDRPSHLSDKSRLKCEKRPLFPPKWLRMTWNSQFCMAKKKKPTMIHGNFYERLHFYMDSCAISPTASLLISSIYLLLLYCQVLSAFLFSLRFVHCYLHFDWSFHSPWLFPVLFVSVHGKLLLLFLLALVLEIFFLQHRHHCLEPHVRSISIENRQLFPNIPKLFLAYPHLQS